MTRHTISGAIVSRAAVYSLNVEDEICVSTVIDNAKALYR